MDLRRAHAVECSGHDGPPIILAHGVGGSKAEWGWLVEHLSPEARVITFALAGSREAEPTLFSPDRHASLLGFADDLLALTHALDLKGAVFVGHALSATTGALASALNPGLFARIVLINGTARYANDPAQSYVGGFDAEVIDAQLQMIEQDYRAWASAFARLLVGEGAASTVVSGYSDRLSGLDPEVAAVVLRAMFTSDVRPLLEQVAAPTLVVQSRNDPAVPETAARWLATAIPRSRLSFLDSEGHFPHLVDPAELLGTIRSFAVSGRL